MTYRTYETDGFALPLPIARSNRVTATTFAREQPTPEKAEQVYLNTLAVSVVSDYLEMMGIATNPNASDSWNRAVRLCADVADLEVTGVGRLECRPIRTQAQTCAIPPEVWEDRIGYVMVQIDDDFQEAKILGFVPTAAVEALPLDQVRSPEDLLDHLTHLRQAVAVQPSPAPTIERVRVNLSQWFEDRFESGWQTLESILNGPEFSPAYAFRAFRSVEAATESEQKSSIRRAKIFEIGRDHSFLLVTELQTEPSSSSPSQTHIRLKILPLNQPLLPQGLRLVVVDESGAVFLEAESRRVDNYIQLQFSGNPGETFSVRVDFEAIQVTEEFVV
ncbi:DUF1822 family protein [Kovacikia minuta CCNUW1]|uniref:DUF1822 family protein n=1 Tax=Kovacikia minuta TaxID=2931930 RepID=UPI001CCD8506|nr:DUF1822 family protein [Kovacikia minuta]UBF23749.1 DUF1822 family protein [Kovacikia minuta CCNUW1]